MADEDKGLVDKAKGVAGVAVDKAKDVTGVAVEKTQAADRQGRRRRRQGLR